MKAAIRKQIWEMVQRQYIHFLWWHKMHVFTRWRTQIKSSIKYSCFNLIAFAWAYNILTLFTIADRDNYDIDLQLTVSTIGGNGVSQEIRYSLLTSHKEPSSINKDANLDLLESLKFGIRHDHMWLGMHVTNIQDSLHVSREPPLPNADTTTFGV